MPDLSAMKFHLAQINIGKITGININDPIMKTFVDQLEEVNALAEGSKGFVWRLKDENNNATNFNPFGDDTIIVNISVWESMEDLQNFIFKGKHAEALRNRKQWFVNFGKPYTAFWYVPAGQVPTVEEAIERLTYLQNNGASAYAFDFKNQFAAPAA
jgi:heme-degrading monooxygenase HmoA